ncbi:MAG: M15 family metallopeptidase [Bacillota bacterium]
MKKIITISIIICILLILNLSFSSFHLYNNFNFRAKADNLVEIIFNTLSSNLILVNKENNLPENYIPEDMVIPDIPFYTDDLSRMRMKKESAEALENLFEKAKKDNIDLAGLSAYRSYSRQKSIFQNKVQNRGWESASKFSAQPGHSEHQTGLAIDITSPSVNYQLSQNFGQTREGKWLADNAAQSGFIIRYPEGKEKITKYEYEPWHLRYVGKDHAQTITEYDLTLEEYLNDIKKGILLN